MTIYVSEMVDGMQVNEVTLRILAKPSTREVIKKNGESIDVVSTMLADETGDIKLTTWGDKHFEVLSKLGSAVCITKAYVSQWQGLVQLNLSKASTLELV